MSIKINLITVAASAAMLIGTASAASAQQKPAPQDGRPKAEAKAQEGQRPGAYGEDGFGPRRGGMRRGMQRGMQRGMRGGMMGPRRVMRRRGLMRMFRGLNLTQGQREQIRGILQANRPSVAVREEMRSIAQARRAGTITEVQKARAKELMEQRRANRESVRQQMLGVLTAEQRQKLDDRRNKMNERRQKMKQRREECKSNPEACRGSKPRPRG